MDALTLTYPKKTFCTTSRNSNSSCRGAELHSSRIDNQKNSLSLSLSLRVRLQALSRSTYQTTCFTHVRVMADGLRQESSDQSILPLADEENLVGRFKKIKNQKSDLGCPGGRARGTSKFRYQIFKRQPGWFEFTFFGTFLMRTMASREEKDKKAASNDNRTIRLLWADIHG